MKRWILTAAMLAVISLSANAAKKATNGEAAPIIGVKSGVITMANNMDSFGGGMGGRGGGFGGGMPGGMGGGFGGGRNARRCGRSARRSAWRASGKF